MDTDFSLAEEFTPIEYETTGRETDQRATPEKHLDSPIVVSLLEHFVRILEPAYKNRPNQVVDWEHTRSWLNSHPEEDYSSIREPLRQLCDWMNKERLTVHDVPEILVPADYPTLIHCYPGAAENSNDEIIEESLKIYERIVDCYMAEVEDLLSPSEYKKVREKVARQYRSNPSVDYYGCRATAWNTVCDEYRRQYARNRPGRHRRTQCVGDLQCIHLDGYSIIRYTAANGRQTIKLAVYTQLQMLLDVILSRENLFCALALGIHNGTERLYDLVSELLTWQEKCIKEYNNSGFELVKQPEALMKAHVNTLSGGDILCDSSYNRTLRKIEQKELKIQGSVHLTTQLSTLCRSIDSVGDALELFGLIKVSGHPTVNAVVSATSVRNEACPYLRTSPLSIINTRRCFQHIFLNQYLQRHAEWPKFRCTPKPGTLLHRHWANRTTVLPSAAYDLSDLDHIRFAKCLDFDYSPDFLKFLDDKAISVGAKDAASFWYGGESSPRRLILKAIKTEKIDMREIVERLRRGGFTPDELIVELTQKERELKPAARCFCKMVLAVRCFFVLTEFNLGESFMPHYLPQQTMTMSNADIKKRLHAIASRSERDEKNSFLEIDFSRWNLRWRARTVNPIAWMLEDIYGLPGVFSQAHWFFEHATIVLTDKHMKPPGVKRGMPAWMWPTSSLVWRGHKGGFEGIAQKLWSIITICMVFMALLGTGVSFLMAGQGDNQILALTTHDNRSRRDVMETVLAHLDMYCKSLGHDVKPEECIDSSTVISYSKEFYVNGVHRMYTLKFAARTLRRDESDVPSLSAEVSGCCAMAMLVADTSRITLHGYLWQLVSLHRLIIRRGGDASAGSSERRHLRRIREDSGLRMFCLLLPGSLGGLPILSHTRFRIKGEVDDLSWDMCAVKQLQGVSQPLSYDVYRLLNGALSPKLPDLGQLIADPRSIPILRPRDERRLIRDAVAAAMPSQIENTWIKEIVTSQMSELSQRLIKHLTSMSPLFPQIASDIHAASLAGLNESILSRFNFVRSIRSITGGLDFTHEITQANSALLKSIIDRYTHALGRGGRAIPPSSIACTELRKRWNLGDIHKVIGTYCPLEWRLTTRRSNSINATSRSPIASLHSTLGPYPPNFGTRTRQKRSEHGYKIVTSSGTVKDLRSLVMIASELKAGPSLRKLINQIIRSRCPWDLGVLERVLPTAIGGTAAHRHENLNSGFFGILGSCTIPTHLNFDTDTAGILSGGEDDYAVVFQEFFLLLTNIYSVFSASEIDWSGGVTFGYAVPDLDPLPDISVDTTESETHWPAVDPDNCLAYTKELQFTAFQEFVPDDIVPVRPSPTVNEILFTIILHKLRFTSSALTSLRGAIIHTADILDIKEARRLTLHNVYLTTAAAVVVEGLYATRTSRALNSPGVLEDCIHRLAISVASSIAKTFVHPLLQASTTARRDGIVLQPGGFIPLSTVDSVTGAILNYSRKLLETDNYPALVPSLIITESSGNRALGFVERYQTALLACTMAPGKLYAHRDINRRMYAARLRAETASSLAEGILTLQTEYRLIIRDLRRAYGRNPHIANIPDEPRVYQWRGTNEELVRILRERPAGLPLSSTAQCAQFNRTASTGRIKFTQVRGTDGDNIPLECNCKEDQPLARLIETRTGYLFRTSGRYASVKTVWDYILSQVRCPASALVVGVGRGALVGSLVEHGCTRVVGVDLRSTFPLVTQRELSYKPPELIDSELEKFDWADEVFGCEGGDLFTLDLPSMVLKYDCDAVIIDTEIDHVRVATIALALDRRVIIRGRYCIHEATAIATCAREATCFDLGLTSVARRPMVLDIRAQGITTPVSRLRVETRRPFHPRVRLNREVCRQRLDDLVRPFGLEVPEISAAHLRELSRQVTRITLNSADPGWTQKGREAANTLSDCARLMLTDDVLEIEKLIRSEGQNREHVRLILLTLSNTRPGVLTEILQLREEQ